MYIVAYAVGGLIDSLERVDSAPDAIKKAEGFWSSANPETDDVKVFADDGTLYWEPKRATRSERP